MAPECLFSWSNNGAGRIQSNLAVSMQRKLAGRWKSRPRKIGVRRKQPWEHRSGPGVSSLCSGGNIRTNRESRVLSPSLLPNCPAWHLSARLQLLLVGEGSTKKTSEKREEERQPTRSLFSTYPLSILLPFIPPETQKIGGFCSRLHSN